MSSLPATSTRVTEATRPEINDRIRRRSRLIGYAIDALGRIASPAYAAAALAVVAGCLVAAAVVGARLGDRHEAVLNLGFVLAWVAWSGGRMEEVFRAASGVDARDRTTARATAARGAASEWPFFGRSAPKKTRISLSSKRRGGAASPSPTR